MNQKQKKLLQVLFIVIFMTLFVTYWVGNSKEKREVLRKNKKTVGWLIEYDDGGSDFSAKSIKYGYDVLGVTFTREVNVTVRFKICQDFESCKDKRYWVIYSPDNPKNSLINLEIEIQEIENTKFPESLDDFK